MTARMICERCSIKCYGTYCKNCIKIIKQKDYGNYNSMFNKKFKNMIKKRDKKCMLCNKPLNLLINENKRIIIHHIDYNKLNSIPLNCITLCGQCHSKTSIKRKKKYYIILFKSILNQNEIKLILNFLDNNLNNKFLKPKHLYI